MKFLLSIILILSQLFFSTCATTEYKVVELNKNSALTESNSSITPANLEATPSPSSSSYLNFDTISPRNIGIFDVILSPIDERGKGKKIQYDFYENQLSSWVGEANIKEGSEFDLMNEYGFLGKGRVTRFVAATKTEEGYWEIEVLRDSLRSNIDELANTRMREREKESPSLPAIGIFPSLSTRKHIRSGDKIDMSEKAMEKRQAVYLSLPKEIRDNADVYGQSGSLEYPNTWADLDGDGNIDYVDIRVQCEERVHSHCNKNLLLLDGKWNELTEPIKKN